MNTGRRHKSDWTLFKYTAHLVFLNLNLFFAILVLTYISPENSNEEVGLIGFFYSMNFLLGTMTFFIVSSWLVLKVIQTIKKSMADSIAKVLIKIGYVGPWIISITLGIMMFI